MAHKCPRCQREFFGQAGIGSHATKCGVTPEELFWAKVDKSGGPEACWPWTAALTSWRYGHFHCRKWGKDYMSHRLAWEFTNGPIPAGMLIQHTCDNPPCCNVAHMRLGTNETNMQDMVVKGRKATKLNADQVREIRRILASPDFRGTNTELGMQFGISASQVSTIKRRRQWTHIK